MLAKVYSKRLVSWVLTMFMIIGLLDSVRFVPVNATETVYELNTSTQVDYSQTPWKLGYFKVSDNKFTPDDLMAYPTYQNLYGGRWMDADLYTQGGLGITTGANCFVGTAYEPAIVFTAPNDGVIKIDYAITPSTGGDGIRYKVEKYAAASESSEGVSSDKIYPSADEADTDGWKLLEPNGTEHSNVLYVSVSGGESVQLRFNSNANQNSDTFKMPKYTITYLENLISYDTDKYVLTYCPDEADAAINNDNIAEIKATAAVPAITDANITYTSSDNSVIEPIGSGRFKIKKATGINSPITVTAKSGTSTASVQVYAFEQKLTSADDPDSYPFYTGTTAATQGPVWYVKSATPMKVSADSAVYSDLKADICTLSNGTKRAILWTAKEMADDSRFYDLGFSYKDSTGTAHTGANGDITLAFKAPRTGRIHLSSVIPFNNTSKTSGFNYRIAKNTTQLYPESGWAFYKNYTNNGVAAEDNTVFFDGLDTDVEKGDFIYITVNNNGSNSNGGFGYVPTVTYIEEDSNPFGLDVYKGLALTNVSSDGGVDNNDTLQKALHLPMAQAEISITDGETQSDGKWLADAFDYSSPGEFKTLATNSDSVYADIKLTGESAGKTLKNLDVVLRTKIETSYQTAEGIHYNLEFKYSTTENPTEFKTFYKTSSARVPVTAITYPVIRINDTEGKISNIDTIRIISSKKNGYSAVFGEVDFNTAEDSASVASAKEDWLNHLKVDGVYADNMMFQQKKPIVVTGKGGNGTVNVTLTKKDDSSVVRYGSAASAKDGWKVSLDALDGGFDKYTLSVSDGNTTKTFNDIVVGELWLTAGQSNMMFYEKESSSFETDKLTAANYDIRYFSQDTIAAKEKRDNVTNGRWTVANTAESIEMAYAVGYQFAKNYYDLMGKSVPVGMVQVAQGSSGMQCFMPDEILTGDFEVLNNSNDVDPYLNTADSPKWQTRATGLYNGMLNPLNINISGVIWYQAENNRTNCQLYKKLEPTFINMLRQKFDDEKLPFILTQLPSFNDNDSWRNMRDVQMQNALSDPYSGIAVTVDTGEKNNIHPKDKTKVGQRLALVAAGKFKGVDVEYSGPMLDGIKQEGNKLVLSFSHADGLKSGGGELNSFEISADGSTYIAANAVINGEKVEVSADSVTNPRYVRYAYAAYVENPNLYNGSDLPAAPFDASVAEYNDWTVEVSDGKANISNVISNTDSFVKGESLILAAYDSGNTLIDIKIIPYEVIYKESREINESVDFGSDASYIKIMQWKDLNGASPIKAAQTYPSNQ